jgi:hypothetical protein
LTYNFGQLGGNLNDLKTNCFVFPDHIRLAPVAICRAVVHEIRHVRTPEDENGHWSHTHEKSNLVHVDGFNAQRTTTARPNA